MCHLLLIYLRKNIFTTLFVVQMLVYSLGMTLYWAVDFQLPQNQVVPQRCCASSQGCRYLTIMMRIRPCVCSQPVQLTDHLNSVLLSMCEDVAHRRLNLNSILEACESQHKASILPSPTKVIKRLAEEVFREPVSGGFSCNCSLLRSVITSPSFCVIDMNIYGVLFVLAGGPGVSS